MKKILAYLACVVAAAGMCWFELLAISEPYGTPGRGWHVLGLGICMLIAIVFAAYGNSLPWKKDKE